MDVSSAVSESVLWYSLDFNKLLRPMESGEKGR